MTKIKKQKNKAWVSFYFNNEANEVYIMGSWNKWEKEPMKRKKDGSFYVRKSLPVNQTYEFGYLADGKWLNDENCEKINSPFGSENSVLKL
jgi:hypothetical protein